MLGIVPTVGGAVLTWVLVRSAIDLADPANSVSGQDWLGIGAPLAIGILFALLGIALMALRWWQRPAFFRRRTEVAEPVLLEATPAA